MSLLTTEDALHALSGLTNWEQKRPDGPRALSLERPRRLLEHLGRPDLGIGAPVVQVGGTKGKGSVARFLASILERSGRRTGLFVSPHLERVEERIQVNGRPIEGRAFASAIERVLDAARGETTFFEAVLAAACLHFREQRTEACVFEVGLGGRLDATTAVRASHTVITEISLDHTRILGETLEEIAGEKAGILRPGVPLFTAVDPDSAAGRVLVERAAGLDAPFVHASAPPCEPQGVRGIAMGSTHLHVWGRHQAHNAQLAATVLNELPPDVVREGLQAARLPGRCEFFPEPTPVVLDCAHNVRSIVATTTTLGEHLPGRRMHLLVGLNRDKDVDGIVAALAPHAERVFCTQTDSPRAMPAADLARHPAWEGRAVSAPDPSTALAQARTADPETVLLVTGSVYLAGTLRPALRVRST